MVWGREGGGWFDGAGGFLVDDANFVVANEGVWFVSKGDPYGGRRVE